MLLLRWFCRKSFQRRWQYALWIVVLLRLLLPVSLVPSQVSILNLLGPSTTPSTHVMTNQGTKLEPVKNVDGIQAGTKQVGMTDENRTELRKGTERRDPVWHLKSSLQNITDRTFFYSWITGFIICSLWFLWINLGLFLRLRGERSFKKRENGLPIYLVKGLKSPFLFGLLKPSIYVSREIWKDEEMRTHVLLHETVHYRHRDHIWSVLRSIVISIYWFDPFVWVAGLCVKKDCELACDESVLKQMEGADRISYGKTLVKLVSGHKRSEAMFLFSTTMSSGKGELKERVERIVNQQKNIIVILALCVVLVIGACAVTYTSAAKKEATDGMTKAKTSEVKTTDAELVQTMKNALNPGSTILSLFPDDYDKDGAPELFSLVHSKGAEGDGTHGDEVWFVKKGEIKRIVVNGSLSKDSVKIWEVDGRKLFKIEEEFGGSSSTSRVWSVKNGGSYELKHGGEMLTYDGNGEFSTYPSAFDLMPDGTGHTWKRYYLYYDKESGMLKEHGGILISEKELLRVPEAEKVITVLKQKKYLIHEIFYRENGVVNINYSTGSENLNLTLLLKNGKAVLEDPKAIDNPNLDQGGIYRGAAFEEIATYPARFPY